MKQYGLIGEKLGHSLSVPIHEAIWEKISLAASYRLIEIPRGELAAVVPELLRTLDGFNITVPYKTDVMPLLDEITPFAREVGAVNTVLTGEKSRGYNTDDPGFEQMLRHFGMIAASPLLPVPPPGKGPRIAEVLETVVARTDRFAFAQPWPSGTVLARRNTLVASDGPAEIRTPCEDCLLVMPSLHPVRGQTAVRLARFAP